MSKFILGIDPGFAILGWGIIEVDSKKIISTNWGAITSHSSEKIEYRLLKIYEGLTQIISLYKPEEMSLEKVFFNKNAKTVISVSQSQGIVLLLSALYKIPIFEYTPLQVKSALTGYGNSDKQQVQNMLKLLLKLEEIPKPDDAADGLALALCHLQTNRFI